MREAAHEHAGRGRGRRGRRRRCGRGGGPPAGSGWRDRGDGRPRRSPRLEPLVAEVAAAGGDAHAYAVDLADEAATAAWADSVVSTFGRVDGLVHLVGGWRGGKGITETDLADWDWLQNLLVRTVQHTSRAFHDALAGEPGRRASCWCRRPRRRGRRRRTRRTPRQKRRPKPGRSRSPTRSVVRRRPRPSWWSRHCSRPRCGRPSPSRRSRGYTDVADLADAIVELWDEPAEAVNGERIWLAP